MPNITVRLINFHCQPIWSSVNEDEIKIERNNILTHRKIGKLILLWFHLSLNIGLWLLGCAAFALEMQWMQFASVSNTYAALISYNIKINLHESDSAKAKNFFYGSFEISEVSMFVLYLIISHQRVIHSLVIVFCPN